jgi:uncharacterized protein YndB with AHSA1/START domain
MDGNVLSVERVIPAPPEAIFALLTDPAKHCLIDGSGTVKATKATAAQDDAAPLRLGSKFGMAMKAGVSYSMVSEVVEFEQDRRIAWQSRPPGFAGKLGGGRTWRYVLEPTGTGTRVTESWDLSTDRQGRLLKLGGLAKRTEAAMEKTLARIEEMVTEPAPG